MGLPVDIPAIILLIWQLRDRDLQQLFPLTSLAGRKGLLNWCVLHGFREYAALRDAHAFQEALDSPAMPVDQPCAATGTAHFITQKMMLLAEARPDLQLDLTRIKHLQQFILWYLLCGMEETGWHKQGLTTHQVKYLFTASETPGLNRLQNLLHVSQDDIQNAFPLPETLPAYIAWFRRFMTEHRTLMDSLRSRPPGDAAVFPAPGKKRRKPGVNVIGYAYGELGIGEDARMAVKSLLAAGVPVTLINFPPGMQTSQMDRSMHEHVGEKPLYDVNLFCLPALEQARFFAERGSAWINGCYNIGYWPWELSSWPAEWNHLFLLVDEVWASSRHIQRALKAASPVPVRLVPMAVELPAVGKLQRRDFGLPEHTFLFLFAFDLNSSAIRKNPKACLLAFQLAFPLESSSQNHSDVALVIKIHPPRASNSEWEELKRLQRQDPRIFLIEQTLEKADLLALYRCCDCFVSLHRAEGFGRSIAEAMLLKKPVIVTGYSGNLQFTGERNALLVRYKPVRLKKNDYPYGNGHRWAEPSIKDAAEKMRQAYTETAATRTRAELGFDTIKKLHNIDYVGSHYRRLLREIAATSSMEYPHA